ncbi:MAG: hypothetical protein ISR99_01815 [Parcubacteria group bacterium]|nr:hypothetical protein [Parcubacteria group bacterium]
MRSIAIGIILVAIAVSGFVLVPFDFVDASHGPIVPVCSAGEDGVRDCGFCDLISLADHVLAEIVKLAVLFAAIMFAVVGVIMMTNSSKPETVSKAKSIFGSVFIGLIIVLAAWLLVDTILKVMTGEKNDLGKPWQPFTCSGGSVFTPPRTNVPAQGNLQVGGVDRVVPELQVPKTDIENLPPVPPFTPPSTITPLDR